MSARAARLGYVWAVSNTVSASTVVLAAIRDRVAALHAAVEPDTAPPAEVVAEVEETEETDTAGDGDFGADGGSSVTVPAAEDETPDDEPAPATGGPDEPDVERLAEALADLEAVVTGFAPLIEGGELPALRAELAWARSTVEEVRALDGTVDVLEELLEDLDPTLRQGPVEARVGIVVAARTSERRDAVTAMLAQPEWTSLLAHADQLVLTAPIGGRKPKQTVRVLARALADVDATAREAADAVVEAPDPDLASVVTAAHTVATTARVSRAVLGKQARKLADAADALAGALEQRRRSEAVAHWLVDLADLAHRAGEPSFTYGVLHAEAGARRAVADEALAAAVAAYTRPKLRKGLADAA
ncbi:CHAD domain-containing protein [Actinomycetospora flava]|uniref:CHAD domain-containing protein n=1 Tax=Actinomycetospora flava TaxID=3129232 RepID=A0ABU8MAU1_9PSEU